VPILSPGHEFAEKFVPAGRRHRDEYVPEILFNVPGTAHCLGGSVIADSPDRGVRRLSQSRLGYRNMYVCDGRGAANLG